MRELWQSQLADRIQAIIENEAVRITNLELKVSIQSLFSADWFTELVRKEVNKQADCAIAARTEQLDQAIEDRLDKVEGIVTNHLEEPIKDRVYELISSGKLMEILDAADQSVSEASRVVASIDKKVDEYLTQGIEWEELLSKLLCTSAVRRTLQVLITEEVDNALLEQVSYRPTRKKSWWRRLLRWLAGDE